MVCTLNSCIFLDGAIVEVFGELGSTNLSPDVKTALLKQSNVIENVITPASRYKQS